MSSSTPTGFFLENRWQEHLLALTTESLVAGGLYLSDVVGPEWAMAVLAGAELVTLGMHTLRCPRKKPQTVAWDEDPIEIDYGTSLDEVHGHAALTQGDGELQFAWYSSDGEQIAPDDPPPVRAKRYRVEVWAKATPRFDPSARMPTKVRVTPAKQEVQWAKPVITIVYGKTLRDFKGGAKLVRGEGDLRFSHDDDDDLRCQHGKPHEIVVYAEATTNYLQSEPASLTVHVQKAPQEVEWTEPSVTIVYGRTVGELQLRQKVERVRGEGALRFSHEDGELLACQDGEPHEVKVWAEETDDYLESEAAILTVHVKKAPQKVKWTSPEITGGMINVQYGTTVGDIKGMATRAKGNGDLRFSHEDGELLACQDGEPHQVGVWAEETDDYLESEAAILTVYVYKAPQEAEWTEPSITIEYGTTVGELDLRQKAKLVRGEGTLRFSHEDDDEVLPCTGSPHTVTVWVEGTDNHDPSLPVEMTVTVERAPQALTWTALEPVNYGVKLSDLPQPQRVRGDGELVFEYRSSGMDEFKVVLAAAKPPVQGSPHTIRAKLKETDNYCESDPVEAVLVVNRTDQELEWTDKIVYASIEEDSHAVEENGHWQIELNDVWPIRRRGDGKIAVVVGQPPKPLLQTTRLFCGRHQLRAKLLETPNCFESPVVNVTIHVLLTVSQWMQYLGYEEKTNIWMRSSEKVDAWDSHFTIFKEDLPDLVPTIGDTLPPMDSSVVDTLFPEGQFHVTVEYFQYPQTGRQPRYMRGSDQVWFGDVPEHIRDQLNTVSRRKMIKTRLTEEIKRLRGLIRKSGMVTLS
ncbi:hypothetical protein [Sorangium sp. So ce1000]|uniref:hypothetical protein n=1 Tax=Sorangium sp. So ce1000 TaxID=3133325 RepID=UPI003F619E13